MLWRWCGSTRRSTVWRGVLGPWGPEKTEGSGADDNGAGVGEAGTEGAEACGSPKCSTGGGCSSAGISAAGWSSAGRGTERGISKQLVDGKASRRVMTALQSRLIREAHMLKHLP